MPKGIFTAKRGIGRPFEKGHKDFRTPEGLKAMAEKLSKLNKGKKRNYPAWNRGKKLPQYCGENSPVWKGGHSLVKRKAKERDNYICQHCYLNEPEIMHVDHIIPRAVNIYLKNEIDNLITLCPNCHARKTNIDRKQYKFSKKWKK